MDIAMALADLENDNKLKSTDRIFILAPMEGGAKSTTGAVDNRLFTGENRLHAIMDGNCLWRLRYDSGLLQQPLRQTFTSFKILRKFVEDYFRRRNIEIKEIRE
jgi:hypothetical protein